MSSIPFSQLDVFVTNKQITSVLKINERSGGFVQDLETVIDDANGPSYFVQVADINGDGALDLFVGNIGNSNGDTAPQPNQMFLNDGNGVMTAFNADDLTASNYPSPGVLRGIQPQWAHEGLTAYYTYGAAFGDVDGDGDQDVVLANAQAVPNQLMINDGTGRYTWLRDSSISALSTQWGADNTYAVALGDVNGDGHLDLLVANARTSYATPIRGFNQVFTSNADPPARTDSANRGNFGLLRNQLFINDGTGNFTEDMSSALRGSDPSCCQYDDNGTAIYILCCKDSDALAFADVNNDGNVRTQMREPNATWPPKRCRLQPRSPTVVSNSLRLPPHSRARSLT